MKIEHIALWTTDLEKMKAFYTTYFKGIAGEKYHNPIKKFSSYFIRFSEGCRLELMHKPDMPVFRSDAAGDESIGLTHFAMSLGSQEAVNALTHRLAQDGYLLLSKPRTTGDGYYESVVADPEGNRIELTV